MNSEKEKRTDRARQLKPGSWKGFIVIQNTSEGLIAWIRDKNGTPEKKIHLTGYGTMADAVLGVKKRYKGYEVDSI